jgi:hypothetical protein
MTKLQRAFASLLILAVTSLACSVPGFGPAPQSDNRPSVAISSPAANTERELGQQIEITSVSVDPNSAIVRVELEVDGQVVWVDANANPQDGEPFIVAQPWTPDASGSYTVLVRAFNRDNTPGESGPLTMQVIAPQTEVIATQATQETAALASAATATPLPTATSGPPTITPSPTVALPTATPTVTPTPTATPAPQKFSPTGLQPEGRFYDIWLELGAGDSRLGYPVAAEIADRDYARQRFKNGLMFWWDNPENPDYIWVIDSPADDLRSGTTSNLYPDIWESDAGEVSCPEAEDGGPIRGFGKVWCDHPELHSRLGKPTEAERGSGGNPPQADVQFFQGGVMIYSPSGSEVFVLFAQGDWQRFDY